MATIVAKLCFTSCLVLFAHAQKCAERTPGLQALTIDVGGTTRQFYVNVPSDIGEVLSPAVFMFHGCGSSPEKFEFESSMTQVAIQNKYFLIYLRGTDNVNGNSVRLGWNAGFSTCNTKGEYNDVEFAKAVHARVLEEFCVDPKRTFAAGFSNGGSMVSNLTCTMNEEFAGFAITGSTMPTSVYPDTTECARRPEAVKPVLAQCGSRDGCGSSIGTWFTNYAKLMDCRDAPKESKVSDTTTCTVHTECGAAGAPTSIEYCLVQNLGHCWSRGGGCCDSQCLDQSPENIDLSKKLISFFDEVDARTALESPQVY